MGSIHTELYNLARLFFAKIAPITVQRIVERFKEKSLIHDYDFSSCSSDNEVICMIDGKVKHGGLTDRINGIISCFDAALKANRNFKIHFRHPFNLKDYLVPNKYDWIINPENIVLNQDSKPLFIRSINTRQEEQRGIQLLHDLIKYPNKQLHVYTNINSVDDESYHRIFHKLFKPSIQLNDILDKEREQINGCYVSATFRFQQLLNDFKEGDYKILHCKERDELISKCISVIKELNKFNPNKKILVTSDSSTFLEKIRDLSYVYVISGKTVHMEYDNSNDFSTHVKAFVDLFLISEAEIIYSIVVKPMYESGFPKFASKIHNRPFKLISFN